MTQLCFLILVVTGGVIGALKPVDNSHTEDGFHSYTFATNVGSPRGIYFDQKLSTLIILERTTGNVVSLNQNGEKHIVVSDPDLFLNHAVEVGMGYLYASSSTTIYRWSYGTAGNDIPIATSSAEIVVDHMPSGGHVTRTIKYKSPYIYVSIGSRGNVDPDSARARIMRYDVSSNATFPIDWSRGELFADGTRNEVALAFHPDTKELWGAENGCDNVHYKGMDVHVSNPGEEINLFAEKNAGKFYGYPNCFSAGTESSIQGATPGKQYQDTRAGTVHSDEWCQNTTNVIPPQRVLHPHVAPLGMNFALDSLFISCHGSWNSPTPVGYEVVRVPFGSGSPGTPVTLFSSTGSANSWGHRPVDVVEGTYKGTWCLFISSDASSTIFIISKAPIL